MGVRVGMTLPTMVGDLDRERLVAWCRGIDDGPFHSVAVGERITFPNTEQVVTLAAAAALTDRVRIATTLLVLPMHPVALVAKQAAALDVVSGGRLTLGVGIGGRDEDYRAVGVPFTRRHQRLDRQVAELRRLWAGEPPAPGLEPVGPPPVQPGGPPLLAGAMGPRSLARAARWADGVAGFALDPTDGSAEAGFAQATAAWRDAGRDDHPHLATSFWYGLGADAPSRVHAYAVRYLGVFGEAPARAMADLVTVTSEEGLHAALAGLAASGCDEVFLVPTSTDPAELVATAEVVAAVPGLAPR